MDLTVLVRIEPQTIERANRMLDMVRIISVRILNDITNQSKILDARGSRKISQIILKMTILRSSQPKFIVKSLETR